MKINVLVVGAGMYVSGRGTLGCGTVLPALAQACKDGVVGKIFLAATSQKSMFEARKKVKHLEEITGIKLPIQYYPQKGKNEHAYREALKQKPDCAIVAVPDHLHFVISRELIKKGIHVLVVKPLTPQLSLAKELVALAEKNAVLGMVEYHKRYDDANLKLRDCFQKGELGDILYVAVEFSQRRNIPEKLFKSWAQKTNIFQYLGVHYLDLIYFCTRAKPVRVLALGQKNYLAGKGIQTYDSIQVLTQWKMPKTKNLFTSAILVNWIDPETTSAMSDQKIKVIGTKGRYESDQKNRGVQIVTQDKGIVDFNPYFSQFYPGIDGKPVFKGYGERSIRQFLDDVLKIAMGQVSVGKLCGLRPTFKDALVSTAAIEAANKSLSRNGAWVVL